MWWFLSLLFGAVLILNNEALYITNELEDLIIQTESGLVRGTENITVDLGKTYYSFKGIPYAVPPIGELRFKPPVPAQPWDGILEANQDKDTCVQGILTVTGQEDCLYLNIYTPKVAQTQTELLPVMLWIHGGGFYSGGSQYSNFGPDYFLEHDVIVVTFNYRIGVFGFLSTGDFVAPGNVGLKDQNLAMNWVNRNIENFGGNKDNITLFGSSAGSASVSLHLQSTKSRGLFNKAIMQSGTSLCLWSLSRHAREAAFTIGTILNLNTTNSETLLTDLRNVDYGVLQLVSMITFGLVMVTHNPINGLVFVPVIEPEHDDAFFTSKSHELLNKGDFEQVPTIIGYNSLEVNLDLAWPIMLYLERYDLIVSDLVSTDMNIKNDTLLEQIGSEIKNHFFGTAPIGSSLPHTLRFITDHQFNLPIHETMNVLSNYVTVYCYRFNYQGELGGANNKPEEGVKHGEELRYFWRVHNANSSASESDYLTRARSVKMWANFAKFGNPTPDKDPLLNDVNWPFYKTDPDGAQVSCLNIDTELEIIINPDNDGLDFYKNLYASFGVPPFDTY